MKPFTPEQHRDALIRRRLKFVVEKGAVARLFKGGTHSALPEELCNRISLAELARRQFQDQDNEWLTRTVALECWSEYARNGIASDRWGYFAKLINKKSFWENLELRAPTGMPAFA